MVGKHDVERDARPMEETAQHTDSRGEAALDGRLPRDLKEQVEEQCVPLAEGQQIRHTSCNLRGGAQQLRHHLGL